jgi:glutamate synthase (NADPH/NADH) large chain
MHDEPVFSDFPLYDPRTEHDACGIGFVVNLDGRKSHEIITKGIEVLVNLTHRGACGCDPETGDGAGVTIQIPHALFAGECEQLGFALPAEGEYGVGMIFLPVEPQPRFQCQGILDRLVQEEGLSVLGWPIPPLTRMRLVARRALLSPISNSCLSGMGRA